MPVETADGLPARCPMTVTGIEIGELCSPPTEVRVASFKARSGNCQPTRSA
jgi:hypothetical protein